MNLGAGVLAQIAIITLALAAVSGLISVTITARYEPLKILTERT